MNTLRPLWQEVDAELTANGAAYATASLRTKRAMERRALLFASLTIHTPWPTSIKLWRAHRRNPLPVTAVFFSRRRLLPPDSWLRVSKKGSQAKTQFARSLLGYTDAACFDVHMLRAFPTVAKVGFDGTRWQWSIWLLKIYPAAHPSWNHAEVLRQHATILRWVRFGGRRRV